jgi:hypothetical protein
MLLRMEVAAFHPRMRRCDPTARLVSVALFLAFIVAHANDL